MDRFVASHRTNKNLDTIQILVPCINVHAGSFANQVEFDPFVLLGAFGDQNLPNAILSFDSSILVLVSEPSAMDIESLLDPSNLGEVEFISCTVPASLSRCSRSRCRNSGSRWSRCRNSRCIWIR